MKTTRLLAKKRTTVRIWAKTENKACSFRETLLTSPSERDYINYISYSNNKADVIESAEYVIWAVPAQSLREVARQFYNAIANTPVMISLAKGLEADTGKRMSEILSDEFPSIPRERICALSGPNLSKEIGLGLPATSVIASTETSTAEKARAGRR